MHKNRPLLPPSKLEFEEEGQVEIFAKLRTVGYIWSTVWRPEEIFVCSFVFLRRASNFVISYYFLTFIGRNRCVGW
jgi:hypothetical protein